MTTALTAAQTEPSTSVDLRPAAPADAPECGRIIFEAFRDIAERHGFPADFPSVEAGTALAASFIAHPSIFAVVAVSDGRVIGSNFLDERDAVRGVGPITVDPSYQGAGVGRRLMQAVIERGRDAGTIQLQQDAFNTRSLSLYASLGFDVTHPTVLITGTPADPPDPAWEIRPLTASDLDACDALCAAAHGQHRGAALRDALRELDPYVAVRDRRVVAYASTLGMWSLAHAAAHTPRDMQALIAGYAAATGGPVQMLVPIRHTELLRWCLTQDLRVVKPMNIMALGEYHEPLVGCWIPSVLY
jgi:GNAT superfamily N-acetyltransferase